MQVRLLRVLQNKTFIPVGSNISKKVKARIICATNKDLELEVEAGHFRQDLYYRINVIKIVVPLLVERTEDIPLLVDSFLQKYAKEFKQKPKIISKAETKTRKNKITARRKTMHKNEKQTTRQREST